MQNTTPTDNLEPQATPSATPRPLWIRLLKWTGISVAVVIALLLLVITVAVWILTPARLTPLAMRYANEFLDADVASTRVELTFWSTFPRLTLDVDSLSIVSHSLHTADPDSAAQAIPADADSLFSIRSFHAGINLISLAKGEIRLYDVLLTNPRANIYIASDSVNNFNIVPPAPADSTPDSTQAFVIPPFAIDRFAIIDGFPVRLRMPADSIDVTLTLNSTEIGGTDNPRYTLSLRGDALGKVIPVDIPRTPFGIDGTIAWDCSKPSEIEFSDFDFSIDDVRARFSTSLSMADSINLRSLHVSIPDLKARAVVDLIPDTLRGPLDKLDTDLSLDFTASLVTPYTVGAKHLPDVDMDLDINASRLIFDKLDLHSLRLKAEAALRGSDLNASTISIRDLSASGKAIDFTLSADITNPIADPTVKGDFDGSIAFDRLPAQLLDKLTAIISGSLHGKADFATRKSWLTPKKFHRTTINGQLSLSDFSMTMRDTSLSAFIHRADFSLGTRSKIKTATGLSVDSLLTASLSVDTISLNAAGISLASRALKAGIGARNTASTLDTTSVTPIGGSFSADLITLRSDSDSIFVRLREPSFRATLRRYNGNARAPRLDIDLESRAIRYADRLNRAAMSQAHATFTLHPRARGKMSARMAQRFDSIAALHPTLSADSIRSLAMKDMMKNRRRQLAADSLSGRENLTVDIDNSLRTLLRRWQAGGKLNVRRARLFTPYFPARNTLSDVDLTFSTDSVLLRDTRLNVGHSDFTLNGAVRGISRALTSRHGAPISVEFSMTSDTIDINEISATLLRGAALTHMISQGELKNIAETDNPDDAVSIAEAGMAQADTAIAPLIIPSNITANLGISARNVIYNDLNMRRCVGQVDVFDGALNIPRLHAATDIGTILFSALYSAPAPDDISMAGTMTLKNVNLRKVLHLVPQIDSLMPLLKEVEGIVDADAALTASVDRNMNIDLNTVNMALKLSGDSLVLLDSETFRTLAKWMMFKHKDRNMINHMDVEIAVHDGFVDLYPFIFDMDRYRLGVRGSNDANLNLDYHVAVIKSPIPFKFGINIKGTPDNMKIRLGKARLDEKSVASTNHIGDTVRVNLKREISKMFRRGIHTAGSKGLRLYKSSAPRKISSATDGDTLSHADSLQFIRQGIMERPQGFIMPEDTIPAADSKRKKKR